MLAPLTTKRRNVKSVHNNNQNLEPDDGELAVNECDTNADTCCLGKNFKIIQYTNRHADVYAYDTQIAPNKNVPIVSGATAYDDEVSGTTFILVFHESLYYGKTLDHSLINPNQCRMYGIDVNDNPFDRNNDMGLKVTNDLFIPLKTNGTKILFTSRCPTQAELESCVHVDMTSKISWNPEKVTLGQISIDNTSTTRMRYSEEHQKHEYQDPKSDEAILHSVNPVLIHLNQLVTKQISEESSYRTSTQDIPKKKTFMSTDRHRRLDAEQLAENFMVGTKRAQMTIDVTTQRGTRSAIMPISRRYRMDRYFDLKRLQGKFASDTLWGRKRSLHSNVAAQIYSHKCGFKALYPMRRANGENVGNTLNEFIRDFGAPSHLTFDGAAVQIGASTKFQETLKKSMIDHHISGPRRPDENPAEAAIRDLKLRWYRLQSKCNVPPRLWDYGMKWVCETENLMANSSKYCKGRTPIKIITGETPDISEYTDFGFYDFVTFKQNAGLGEPELGRWLGVSHKVGQLMSYWILPSSGIPISCCTVQRLTNAERQTDEWKQKISNYEEKLKRKWEANIDIPINQIPQSEIQNNLISFEEESEMFKEEYNRVISSENIKESDDYNQEYAEVDPYLNMTVNLKREGESREHLATVKRRAVDDDGRPIGIANSNPILDTRQYEVEYLDGHNEVLMANTIAENILSQVDDEGHRQMMLEEIEDHRKTSDAIKKDENDARSTKIITTKGWELLIRWKNGSTDWVKLKDLKDAYPVQLTDYAIKNKLQDEPAFAWWLPFANKKRRAILKKIKTKYWDRTHKYGIRIPKSIEEAKRIDEKNKNTLWMDGLREEMKNNRVAFKEFQHDPDELIGYQKITGHVVFDIKLAENFRRKVRFVADGYKVETSPSIAYSTVVSRDSVRIILTTAAFHGLEVLGADIQNAFLTAPTKEKVWLEAGPEFGPEQGKTFIIVRALYGLKSAGASFRSFMAEKFDAMNFESSRADPDVWLRPATTNDGFEHYEYIITYVDDILVVSTRAMDIMKEIQGEVKFKKDKIEPPDIYLGARLKLKEIDNIVCWTISSSDYIKSAIETIEKAIEGRALTTNKKAITPFSSNYKPELDVTDELDDKDTQFFQEMIGILRWGTEIGRLDILYEVSTLSQHQALPRQGHMEQALHIFSYLKKRPKFTLYMDPRYPKIDYGEFRTQPEDFHEMYRDAVEPMPHMQPKPRGLPFKTTAFVDASHASNKITRRSHTGFVIFLNRAPVIWYSKRQNTVEGSAFSSEFVALKCMTETVQAFRFKLRMFGLIIDEATHVFGDNESVIKNCTKVESVLNRKHNSIAYHYVRWCVAAGIITIAWISSANNLADVFTKSLTVAVREALFGSFTY